jgi:hypothetical protein
MDYVIENLKIVKNGLTFMEILIENGSIITGDGKTHITRGYIIIENGTIKDVEEGEAREVNRDNFKKVINAEGFCIIPGIINGHAHGCITGPLFPSGSKPLSFKKARRNADKMLAQGVTTVLNLCGLAVMDDLEPVNSITPINLKIGTCHLPSSFASANRMDGSGLKSMHRKMTVARMLEEGAVVVGEMGSGAGLGGGVADYKYIPETIEKETGVRIEVSDAHKLKIAVLGRTLKFENYDLDKTREILNATGLEGKITPDRIREIINRIALEPVSESLDSFDEACREASGRNVPVVFHNSLYSAERILELSKKYSDATFTMVAGHCNHPTFTPEEAVSYAALLRKNGVVIDVSTLDCIITHWMNDTSQLEALVREGLADTISTDYGGGFWDSILESVHFIVNRRIATAPEAIAMATGIPAGIFKKAAPGRGLIRKGKVADIVITDEKNMGRVEKVIIEGRIVVDDGWCCY